MNAVTASCYQHDCRPIPGYRSMLAETSAINWRWSVQWCKTYHRLLQCKSVYGTESHAPVNTPKRREHNLIYTAVNLTPKYNRRLRMTFYTIEANYWQTRRIAQPRCNSRASVWSNLTTRSRHLRYCSSWQSWAGRPLLYHSFTS